MSNAGLCLRPRPPHPVGRRRTDQRRAAGPPLSPRPPDQTPIRLETPTAGKRRSRVDQPSRSSIHHQRPLTVRFGGGSPPGAVYHHPNEFPAVEALVGGAFANGEVFADVDETPRTGRSTSEWASFPSVNAEANKALVRRFFAEVLNKGRTELAKEMVADGYVSHNKLELEVLGPEGIQRALSLPRPRNDHRGLDRRGRQGGRPDHRPGVIHRPVHGHGRLPGIASPSPGSISSESITASCRKPGWRSIPPTSVGNCRPHPLAYTPWRQPPGETAKSPVTSPQQSWDPPGDGHSKYHARRAKPFRE